MTMERLLMVERQRELAAKVAARCCGRPRTMRALDQRPRPRWWRREAAACC